MAACLRTGVHYLDTANYEPPEEGEVRIFPPVETA